MSKSPSGAPTWWDHCIYSPYSSSWRLAAAQALLLTAVKMLKLPNSQCFAQRFYLYIYIYVCMYIYIYSYPKASNWPLAAFIIGAAQALAGVYQKLQGLSHERIQE